MSQDKGRMVYPPAEAARLLEISVSGLRRYGLLYEQIYPQLPRDPQGRRLWTPEAVTRLRRAKALMAEGRAVSIQAALEADETPDQDVQEVVLHDPSSEALRRLSAALDTITRLEQTNQQLVKEVVALRVKLEEGDPNADELRRMNAFLLAELERARTTPPAPDVDDGAEESTRDSPLIRAARWLERRIRGR
jgi:DNA-binding transcriptional MerR regulator